MGLMGTMLVSAVHVQRPSADMMSSIYFEETDRWSSAVFVQDAIS